MENNTDAFECLKLENQLCFPLYACSKEIVRRYKPFLDKLDLTYTQYITMLALWEHNKINVSDLGKILFLDSGTLTPLLKKLEAKGYIKRTRFAQDERNVIIEITTVGKELKAKAAIIPSQMGQCMQLSQEDAQTLYKILYKILAQF